MTCDAHCLSLPGTCAAYCGDGVRNGPETCDGTEVPKCHDATTPIGCSDCKLSLGKCVKGYCGDGVKNGAEQCDGIDYPNKACTMAICTTECKADDSMCP